MEKLDSIFFYHLEKAIKSYRQYAQAQLKSKGFGITIDQWLVLKAITGNPGISQNELAQAVFKDKASVKRIIDLLVKQEFLQRTTREGNRKLRTLTVTLSGLNLLERIEPAVLENRKQALSDISLANLDVVSEVLIKINKNCSL